MKSNTRIRRMQRHNRMRARTVHLNLVSLIDVFAVLVFFLLLSASLAADRLNTLGLDLPSPNQPAPDAPPPKSLEVVIRANGLELHDKEGATRNFPSTSTGYDYATLSQALVQVKKTHPKDDQITLLLEPNVPYDVLVQVMDTARSAPSEVVFEGGSRDMFPLISIGDAATPEGAAVPAAPAPGAAP